jgi:hypothetical protein
MQFAGAYRNYPLSNMFQYYGPVHAGMLWDWTLDYKGTPLAPTWRIDYPQSGDAVGECLYGHSLHDTVILLRRIVKGWSLGMELLDCACAKLPFHEQRESQLRIARALHLQFSSALRVMRFYEVRRNFQKRSIPELCGILDNEIADRKELAELCDVDSCLGFHSEAEAYLYDAKRLRESIPGLYALKQSLRRNDDLPKKPERISYEIGKGWMHNKTFRWKLDRIDSGYLRFEIEMTESLPMERQVFELALSDDYFSESIRILLFTRDTVLNNCFECRRMEWCNENHFFVELKQPYKSLAGSVSCAIGFHDRERMLDAWPRRPGNQESQLRLGLRYFLPGFTGDFICGA